MDWYIPRGLERSAQEILQFSPALHITGARQVGKSTLTHHLGLEDATFVTLDDPATLSFARTDPVSFVTQNLKGTLVIDEVQRLPELTLPIKAEIDRDRRPGRFIITGSSDFARGIGQKDSLAGRMIDLHVHPLSQQELAGTLDTGTFIDRAEDILRLRPGTPSPEDISRTGLIEKIIRGGYPSVQSANMRMRNAWLRSYTQHVTVVEETLARESAQSGRLQSLLRLTAAHQAGELVPAKLAREADIPASTVRNYVDTLERLYLLSQAKAWKKNLTSREVSKAKSWVTDSGLAAWLSGQSHSSLENPTDSPHFSHLVEGFVLQEIVAQQGWAENEYTVLHWRDSTGPEVDIICEFPDYSIVAIEVKSGATVKAEHAKHLVTLREKLGSKFRAGFVVAPVAATQPLGEKIASIPISLLWRSSNTR